MAVSPILTHLVAAGIGGLAVASVARQLHLKTMREREIAFLKASVVEPLVKFRLALDKLHARAEGSVSHLESEAKPDVTKLLADAMEVKTDAKADEAKVEKDAEAVKASVATEIAHI